MRVFVTVGTTKFDDLIFGVISSDVQGLLKSQGYTEMVIQSGKTDLVLKSVDYLLKISSYNYKASLDEVR